MPRSTCLAFFLLLFTLGFLAAQGVSKLPQIEPVLATMKGSPKSGTGLALLAAFDSQSAAIRWVRAVYAFKSSGKTVEVYHSADVRQLRFARPNVAGLINARGASAVAGSNFGYALLEGRPAYLQTRQNGSWFLYLFPDDAGLDVSAFIVQFNDCYGFFEARLPGANPRDSFPAFVGMLQGVR